MKWMTALIIELSLLSISPYSQISEIYSFYVSQGILGVTTLVCFGVTVHLYRENARLNNTILDILQANILQQGQMVSAINDLNTNLDIKEAIKEALRGR